MAFARCRIPACNRVLGRGIRRRREHADGKNDYLGTQGFEVMPYDSTCHPVFVDQKNTAMEMILHGQRIATNGDVRLMPTPEQWDLVATSPHLHTSIGSRRRRTESPRLY